MSELSAPAVTGNRLSLEELVLQHEVEQFLYEEAAVLDERRFHEWFDLLADELDYWMPVRSTVSRADKDKEFAKRGESAFFDEDKGLIAERIRKLETPYSWSEDPPSRTRRMLSNIRIRRLSAETVEASCNFLIYRSRFSSEENVFAGRREDTLRRVNGGWKIARRHIFLDQVSLGSANLSIFF
jgi:biphenyl 2,3-dioxygenase subunit beta